MAKEQNIEPRVMRAMSIIEPEDIPQNYRNGIIIAADGDPIEAHRDDDPNVWGLKDVARGRTPDYPVTIYAVSGDSASGIVGRLLPTGEFIPKTPSNVGKTVTVRALAEPDEELEVVWDGWVASHEEGLLARSWAKPEPIAHPIVPGGWQRVQYAA